MTITAEELREAIQQTEEEKQCAIARGIDYTQSAADIGMDYYIELCKLALLGLESKKDADRYRWLREPHDVPMPWHFGKTEQNSNFKPIPKPSIPWPVRIELDHGIPATKCVYGDTLDIAIDAAMKPTETSQS